MRKIKVASVDVTKRAIFFALVFIVWWTMFHHFQSLLVCLGSIIMVPACMISGISILPWEWKFLEVFGEKGGGYFIMTLPILLVTLFFLLSFLKDYWLIVLSPMVEGLLKREIRKAKRSLAIS